MTTQYLGGLTLGEALPGLLQSLALVGQALQLLRGAINDNSALLQGGIDAITGAMGDLESAKDDLASGPLAAVNDQISAATDYLDTLSVANAAAFLGAALAAIDAGRGFVAGLAANDYLSGAVQAVEGGIASVTGQANGLIAVADDMTDVTQYTAEQVAAVQSVKSALDAASTQALNGVVAYAEQLSQLLASGVHTFWYNGTLGSMGGELGSALPETGLSGGSVIAGPVLVVDSANATALTALQAVFGAS